MNLPRLLLAGACLATLSTLVSSARADSAEPPPPPATEPAPPPPAGPAVTASAPVVDLTTLRALRERGTITQAEFDAAMKDIAPSTGQAVAGDSVSLVVGKWSTTLYGFLETDFINDSTQSFNDLAGNSAVQRQTLSPLQNMVKGITDYAGNHGRTQFSIRNTRLGLQLRAPETAGIRASGVLETDFLGYVPSPSYATGAPTEATYFTSPALRLRHAYMRLETPVVDLLIGQYWDLFGWQGVYQPNSVEIQGLPGELYARNPQLRVSKKLASEAASVEIAVAALRPPSRDSEVPEGQGGLRFALPGWKGVVTNGATATSVMPFSIAVTGDYRHYMVPEMALLPQDDIALDTFAGAVDVFIPVIPAKHIGDHALSITAEAVTGNGMADLYTNLTSVGAGPSPAFPTLVNNTGLSPAPVYPQDVDNGLVDFCPIAKGTPAGCTGNPGSLVGIQWTTFIVGLQYYLPGLGGHVWVSGNFSRQSSSNSADFARTIEVNTAANYYTSPAYTVRKSEIFADGNVFVQVVPAARLGLEYAYFNDEYVDGVHGVNNRFQLSGWFIF